LDDKANILVCVPSELKRRVERSLSGIPLSRWPVGRWIGRNQTASELDNSLNRLRFVIGTPRYWSDGYPYKCAEMLTLKTLMVDDLLPPLTVTS